MINIYQIININLHQFKDDNHADLQNMDVLSCRSKRDKREPSLSVVTRNTHLHNSSCEIEFRTERKKSLDI